MTTDDHHGWRAHVKPNGVLMSLEVSIGRAAMDHIQYVTGVGAAGPTYEMVERNVYDGKSVHMPEDMARALYDALAQHFAGETGSRQTRADLVHERGRVDKLTDALVAIATKESAAA